jgi:threonine aldolase
MVAELLGKEDALFLPSGTMCNLIAVKAHTRPGDAVILDRFAHIVRHESGMHPIISGVQLEMLEGDRGRFTARQVAEVILPYVSVNDPPPALLCVEQTHNFGGGSVWPLEQLRDVCAAARRHKLSTHMDGARLMNAVVATGVSAREMAATFDSAWIDLSKGLGCPVGAVLAGSRAFIETAARWKQAFGGAMRQSGIIAAAGIYALEHNVERLAEDHENMRVLARGLAQIPGITLDDPEPATNILYFSVTKNGISAADFAARLEERGVSFSNLGTKLRAVTHLDVTRTDCERAVVIVGDVIKEV